MTGGTEPASPPEPAPAAVRMFDRGAIKHWARPGSIALAIAASALTAIVAGPWAPLVAVCAVPVVLCVHLWSDMERLVRVASDGLEIEVFGWRRLVPWEEVLRVGATKHVLRVSLTRGRALELYRASGRFGLATPPSQPLGALARDVANTVARHRLAREKPTPLASELARGSRPAEPWLADLRALVGTGDPYRAGELPRDELLAVVESAADVTARAGAALALRWLVPTTEERSRIVAARVRIADPALGAALEAALADDGRAAERAALRVRARREPR